MAVEEEKEQEEILEIPHVKPKKIHVINEFLFLASVDKKSAVPLTKLILELELYQVQIQELVDSGIIVPSTKTKFYLDEEAYNYYKEKQKKKFFLTLVSIIIPGFLFLLLGVAWIIIAT
ncbi:MAG: hypothetical protein ACTSXA_02405 [Candidatus Heimdallarchaeota archaeon]